MKIYQSQYPKELKEWYSLEIINIWSLDTPICFQRIGDRFLSYRLCKNNIEPFGRYYKREKITELTKEMVDAIKELGYSLNPKIKII